MTTVETAYPADDFLATDIGHRHFIRHGSTPDWYLWWHDCPAVEHVSWGWFGGQGESASGHVIVRHYPLEVEGSLLCPDCGDHGFIQGGAWVPC